MAPFFRYSVEYQTVRLSITLSGPSHGHKVSGLVGTNGIAPATRHDMLTIVAEEARSFCRTESQAIEGEKKNIYIQCQNESTSGLLPFHDSSASLEITGETNSSFAYPYVSRSIFLSREHTAMSTSTQPPAPPRAALWTAGRGLRGVATHTVDNSTTLFTSTSIAHGQNTLQVAHYDALTHTLHPSTPQPTPSAVYALDLITPSTLAVGLRDGLSLWDVTPSTPPISTATHSLPAAPLTVSTSPDDKYILVVMRTGMRVVNASTMTTVATRESDDELVAGAWARIGVAVAAMRTGELLVMDVQTRMTDPCGSRAPSGTRVRTLTTDGEMICGGGEDGAVWQGDLRGGHGDDVAGVIWNADGHRHWVTTVCPGRGVVRWASGGTDGVVRCWRGDGTCARTLPQHDDSVTGLYVGDEVVSASYDGRVAVNVLVAAA